MQSQAHSCRAPGPAPRSTRPQPCSAYSQPLSSPSRPGRADDGATPDVTPHATHSCLLSPACCSPPRCVTPAAPQTRALGHARRSPSASSSGRTCAVPAGACEARPSHAAHTGPAGREACSPTAAHTKGTQSLEALETFKHSHLPSERKTYVKGRADAARKVHADWQRATKALWSTGFSCSESRTRLEREGGDDLSLIPRTHVMESKN